MFQVEEKQVMKNQIDRMAFAQMGFLALMTLAGALIILSIMGKSPEGENDITLTTAVVACISFSFFVLGLAIYTQLIIRPKEVDVEEELVIHWRFKEPVVIPLEWITDLAIAPKAQHSMINRRTGGAIGLKGKWVRFGLNYEIALAIRQKYFEKYGRYPPCQPGTNDEEMKMP
jgi:hypothetical protein